MEKLYKLISDSQASLFVLFQKTWIYHWNVVGSDFQQLHTLFGEQYTTMFEEVDRISEHMRYLNIKPISTLKRITEVSHVLEADSKIDAKGMVSQLLSDHQSLINLLSETSEEAGKQRQYATENLIQDLMEAHGKAVWMLRSINS